MCASNTHRSLRAKLYWKFSGKKRPSPIDEIYTAHPYYGSRRITEQLRREGLTINRKTVQRHMREMGIVGIHPGPNLSRRHQQHKIYPYLLKNLAITYPNQVWSIDITCIRLQRGWMYLVAILDLYSRYVVEWRTDLSLDIAFVLKTVQDALERSQPQIMNSDQGSHFTSPQYIALLKEAQVQISMDGKGRAADNILIERFWRTLKYEEVYLHDYASPREARQKISDYIYFYNNLRLHQTLGYRTPAELYLPQYQKAQEEVAVTRDSTILTKAFQQT